MLVETEITRDVYIGGFQVTAEAAVEVLDHVSDGQCPLCQGESEPFELPDVDCSGSFKCPCCWVEITVEVWAAS